MASSLQAVLFDLDGTLVDSEKLWTIALNDVAGQLGGQLSHQARMDIVGTDLISSIRRLISDLQVSAEPEVVQRLLIAAMAHLFETSVEWRPGAAELLSAVRGAGLTTALVTSTHRNLVAIVLDMIGRDNFDVIVCGDDVYHTKPDPEPYLRALAQLPVTTRDCVVIEDSPAGSTAAVRAGLATLVVPSELPVPAQPGLTLRDSLVGVDVDTLRGLLG